MSELRTMPSAPVRSAPVASAGLVVLNANAIMERVRVIHEILDSLMVEGHHYHTFGTTKRKVKDEKTGQMVEKEVPQYSLGKPGAEMVCLTFGLTPDLDSVVVADDPDAPRVIQISERVADPTAQYGYKKVLVDRKVTGYYEIKSTCAIWDRSGVLLARASGSCNSCEASFVNQGYSNVKNSILKRAEKRALVAAVLMASGAGDVFVQDLEDLPPEPTSAAQPTGAAQGAPRPAAATTGAAAGWMTEPQKKLLFAKGKKIGYGEPVVQHVIKSLDAMAKADGKKYFDAIADEKPEAGALWAQAKRTVEEPPAQDAPAGAPAGAPAQ